MAIRFIETDRLPDLIQAINSDPEFKLAGRFFDKNILLAVGERSCIVKIRDGVIREIQKDPTFMNPWDFFIRGSAEAWEKFLQMKPPPFFTDLYGCIARKNFEIGGDIEAALAHFSAIARMLEI